MHSESSGTGTPVLALHSSGMSGRQWRKLASSLSARHQVVLPDFLGCGGNPPWPADQPFHFSQDVAALAELTAQLPPAHVVGHSYGGFIASVYARRHPERVRSLSLYDPVAFGVLHDAADAIGLADLARAERTPGFFDAGQGGDEAWMRTFVDYWQGEGAWAALPAEFRAGMLRVGKKVFYEVTTLLADRTPRADYAELRIPSLLLTGERSPPAARRVVALLADALHGRSSAITGAGHMGPISHPDAVNAAIAAHLERVEAA
jgi:pimeloyl-ACP methyl ester carboxylesterase